MFKLYEILLRISIFLAIIALTGAAIYRLLPFNTYGLVLILFFSLIIFYPFKKLLNQKNNYSKPIQPQQLTFREKFPIKARYLYGLFFVFLVASFTILIISRTDSAIISPWQAVPNYFFLFYFLTSFLLILISLEKNHNLFFLFSASAFFLLSLLVANLVYKIYYGYDPFIHETTLNYIDLKGEILPKPFYYIGGYSLIIVLHKIFFIPIAFLNKYLVQILAALFLPLFSFYHPLTNSSFRNQKYLLTIIPLLIISPVFISSTPQNLAYLFLLLTILFGINQANKTSLSLMMLFSLAAASIHPLAGIPGLIFFLIKLANFYKTKYTKIIIYILYFFALIILPFLFYSINHTLNLNSANFNFYKPLIPSTENFLLNLVYLFGFNKSLVVFGLALSGFFVGRKKNPELNTCAALAFFFFIAYLLSNFLSFSYLISYEKNIFPERILTVSLLFSLPLILTTVNFLLNKIDLQKPFIHHTFLIFISLLFTASLYLAYPRKDNYFNSRGLSTGKYDFAAAEYINKNSGNNYIVLANQQLSAAALYKYGFKKYFSNNIFYYPIPTASPLYQFYLDMVYKKPSRETAQKAMRLVGADEAYFVVNKYWWASPKIIEEAKLEADGFKIIGEREVYIFKYKL